MRLSPDEQKKRLEATRGAAAAFVEDLEHMRKTVAAPTRAADLRRLSNELRRLLVNREVQEIAAPRLGRFLIDARDEKPMIKWAERSEAVFFATLGANIRFGDGNHIEYRHFHVVSKPAQLPRDYDPDRRVPLKVDNFLSQPVFFIHGKWITRNNVIKYVANIASGVHSRTPQTEDEKRIAAVRNSVRFPVGDAIPHIKPGKPPPPPAVDFNLDALTPGPLDFQVSKGFIDPLLVEMLAIAERLCHSAHASELDTVIRAELGL